MDPIYCWKREAANSYIPVSLDSSVLSSELHRDAFRISTVTLTEAASYDLAVAGKIRPLPRRTSAKTGFGSSRAT